MENSEDNKRVGAYVWCSSNDVQWAWKGGKRGGGRINGVIEKRKAFEDLQKRKEGKATG